MATEQRPRGKKRGRHGGTVAPGPPISGGDASETRREGFRELTWGAFDALAHQLAKRIADYDPELVIGIVKGGLFVGSAVAGFLRKEFIPVRLSKRSRDRLRLSPNVRTKVPAEVRGKRVLVVDDVVQSGDTLRQAISAIEASGASEVRSAALVVHSTRPKPRAKAGATARISKPPVERPDWFALETDDLVVFPWDYELRAGGSVDQDPGESGA